MPPMLSADEQVDVIRRELRKLAESYPAYLPRILGTLRVVSPRLASILEGYLQ